MRAFSRNIYQISFPGTPALSSRTSPAPEALPPFVRSLDATQPKAGTVLAVFNTGLITESIVEPAQIELDFRKLAWVGVATPDFRVCYGYGASGPKTWDEMMRMKQFVLGC